MLSTAGKSRSKCALSIGVEDYAHFHVEQGPAKLTRPRGQTDAEFLAISNMMVCNICVQIFVCLLALIACVDVSAIVKIVCMDDQRAFLFFSLLAPVRR